MPLVFGSSPSVTTVGVETRIANGKLNSAAPNTYPAGLSTATVISGDGWPAFGTVVTLAQDAYNYVTQHLIEIGGTGHTYFRRCTSTTTWSTWKRLLNDTDDVLTKPLGIIAAWTLTAGPSTASAAERVQFTWSFTALASRTYRVVVSGGLVDSESTVAQGALCNIRWQQGSAVTTSSAACGRQIVATAASTNADLMSGVHAEGLITTATAGTVNCGFFIAAANAVNLIRYYSTSISTRVYVEDMGPSVTVNTLTLS